MNRTVARRLLILTQLGTRTSLILLSVSLLLGLPSLARAETFLFETGETLSVSLAPLTMESPFPAFEEGVPTGFTSVLRISEDDFFFVSGERIRDSCFVSWQLRDTLRYCGMPIAPLRAGPESKNHWKNFLEIPFVDSLVRTEDITIREALNRSVHLRSKLRWDLDSTYKVHRWSRGLSREAARKAVVERYIEQRADLGNLVIQDELPVWASNYLKVPWNPANNITAGIDIREDLPIAIPIKPSEEVTPTEAERQFMRAWDRVRFAHDVLHRAKTSIFIITEQGLRRLYADLEMTPSELRDHYLWQIDGTSQGVRRTQLSDEEVAEILQHGGVDQD